MKVDTTRPQRPSRVRMAAMEVLDDLTRRVGALWSVDPHVDPRSRQQFLEELQQLDIDIERLVLRSASGSNVAFDDVRSCQQRYLWLRERWDPLDERTVPGSGGRAA